MGGTSYSIALVPEGHSKGINGLKICHKDNKIYQLASYPPPDIPSGTYYWDRLWKMTYGLENTAFSRGFKSESHISFEGGYHPEDYSYTASSIKAYIQDYPGRTDKFIMFRQGMPMWNGSLNGGPIAHPFCEHGVWLYTSDSKNQSVYVGNDIYYS